MGNKIETKDIKNEEVICSDKVWFGHIVMNHPIMKNNLEAVKDTIENPEVIHLSSEDSDRKVYFKKSELSTYNMYTKVVTKTVQENKSEIVSSWPQKSIKGGIGVEIYHK